VVYTDVLEAFAELFNSKTVQVLQSLQQSEVCCVLSLLNELMMQKKEKILIDDV
jgi:hypothetical protein